jgi:hypothetical protein
MKNALEQKRADAPDERPKKPYTSPTLTKFGDVVSLTGGITQLGPKTENVGLSGL